MASKYDHIDFVPPKSVAAAAARGLELRQKAKKSNKGGMTAQQASKEGIGSGVQRAVNLKNRNKLSPGTVKQMLRFFQRHEKNMKIDAGKTALTDKGYQAGQLWGGQPGFAWARKVVRQMEAADAKSRAKKKAARFDVITQIIKSAAADIPTDVRASELHFAANLADQYGLRALAAQFDDALLNYRFASEEIDDEDIYTDEGDPADSYDDYRDPSEEDYQQQQAESAVADATAMQIAEVMARGFDELGLAAKIEDGKNHVDIIIGKKDPILISINKETKEIQTNDIKNGPRTIPHGAFRVFLSDEWTEDYV